MAHQWFGTRLEIFPEQPRSFLILNLECEVAL